MFEFRIHDTFYEARKTLSKQNGRMRNKINIDTAYVYLFEYRFIRKSENLMDDSCRSVYEFSGKCLKIITSISLFVCKRASRLIINSHVHVVLVAVLLHDTIDKYKTLYGDLVHAVCFDGCPRP